jgi:hypothetical protein
MVAIGATTGLFVVVSRCFSNLRVDNTETRR